MTDALAADTLAVAPWPATIRTLRRIDRWLGHLLRATCAALRVTEIALLIEMTGMAAVIVTFLSNLLGHVRGGLSYVPPDLQKIVATNFNDVAVDQRADFAKLNESTRSLLIGKGMVFDDNHAGQPPSPVARGQILCGMAVQAGRRSLDLLEKHVGKISGSPPRPHTCEAQSDAAIRSTCQIESEFLRRRKCQTKDVFQLQMHADK